MIAFPALDLKDRRCVQLVGGVPGTEEISLADPLAVARHWWETGYHWLHVVDLDAALELGDNRDLVGRLCQSSEARVQVGGGLRDEDSVTAILDAGAERAIVGTRAIDDRRWLESIAARHPHQIVVAADIRNGRVVRRGWTESSEFRIEPFLLGLEGLPLAGVLCTDVGREGRVEGIDRSGMAELVRLSPAPLLISGGISTEADLAALAAVGAAGAVMGMALYTNRLSPEVVARAYGGGPDEERQ